MAATIAMIAAAALRLLAQAPTPVVTADGVLEFVANAADGTVTVTDRLNRTTLSRSLVCPGPSLAGLTPDEVAAMVLCAGSNELVFLNTAAFDVTARVALAARPVSVVIAGDGRHAEVRGSGGGTMALVALESQRQVGRIDSRTMGAGRAGRPNELVFLGMIHGEHRTSQRFGLDVVRRLVDAIAPDYWLTEIPANRLARASEEFARTGAIAEPRVSRFPEYVDVLFPLSRPMRFTVYGTAGWNHPMDRFRRERLAAISSDARRSGDWRAYQASVAESDRQLAAGGAPSPRPDTLHGLSPWSNDGDPLSRKISPDKLKQIVASLDARGAWTEPGQIGKADRVVSVFAARPMVLTINGKPLAIKENDRVELSEGNQPPLGRIIRSATFASNLEALAAAVQ